MYGTNYLRIVAAALAAFVASAAWYTVLGGAVARLSDANPASVATPAWTMHFVVVQSLIVAAMLAYLVSRLGIVERGAALRLGALVWIFPASILLGSVVHENVPLALATIHAGDWLAKLLLMSVILGTRRKDTPLDAPGHRLPQGESRAQTVGVVGR
jgi:Protein of unknown function (DUF1761)